VSNEYYNIIITWYYILSAWPNLWCQLLWRVA